MRPVLAAIAVAAQMPPLADASLRSGYREIRIRSEQVLANFEPSPMIRLIEGPDDIRGRFGCFARLS
jgi:hypothetical protein